MTFLVAVSDYIQTKRLKIHKLQIPYLSIFSLELFHGSISDEFDAFAFMNLTNCKMVTKNLQLGGGGWVLIEMTGSYTMKLPSVTGII